MQFELSIQERAEEVISDSYGMNIQLKKEDGSVVGKKLIKEKQISVSDDIDIGYGKPPIKSIIRSDCIVSSIDKKIIANKVIVNGEMRICFLYCLPHLHYHIIKNRPCQFLYYLTKQFYMA